MRCSRAVAFENLRQALDLHGLLASDDAWCEAIRQRTDVLRQRPLTRCEIWTITRLVEAVLGLNPHQNMAANLEDACRKIEANNRNEGRLSA